MTDALDPSRLSWAEPPDSIGPYRELLAAMVAADEPCPSPTCGVTVLGHLLIGLSPRLVDLVRAEDPTEPNFPGPAPA